MAEFVGVGAVRGDDASVENDMDAELEVITLAELLRIGGIVVG